VARGLLTFVFVACVLSAAAACGAPAADVASPNSPQAQATNVRRTQVAAAQEIIANNPTATPPIAPTPAAPPACKASGAIWWYAARTHVGEGRTVQGLVVATRAAPGGLTLLEIGQPYPDPTGLSVLMPATPRSNLDGKNVCVAGRIAMAEGRPMIQLRDASNISVLN